MWHKITCPICNSILEYENKSICEGNREREEVKCPICNNIVASVFTDLLPDIRLIKDGNSSSN